MEDNKKRKLNLKIKTFSDLKRFKSQKVHEIVGKMRESNSKISDEELKTFSGLVKYATRRSLIRKSDNNRIKQNEKVKTKYNEEKSILKELLENKQITKEQYNKQMEKLIYKTRKKIYEKDLSSDVTEKPKNPTIQRAIKNIGKVVKTVGKGLAVAVASPFVLGYKIATGIGKVAKAIGRGTQTAYLTAGKVADNVKDQVQNANGEVNREMYEKANEKQKQEMMERAYKQADKENAKRDREAARRENLHMNAEQQPIDHEEAKKHTFERVDAEQLSPEEIKQVYGEEK